MSCIVEMKHVYKSFGPVEVLKDFNLQLLEGEKVVIIGPSGSGKSTVLRCINRLETIQSGSIFFESQAIKICIPPLVNQFIMTLKNSSIASLVTITELFRTGEQIIYTTFRSFEVYTAVAVFYLIMNSVFMVIADKLERRMARQ